MNRLMLALKVFGRILFHPEMVPRARDLLLGAPPARVEAPAPLPPPPARPAPARSDAINLLAVLQREARLIDFLKENITPYDDAQIGAAVRDVHRSSAAVLDRLFALRPLMNEAEGAPVTIASGAEAARVRLTGNVAGHPPYRGTLRHQGWEATRVELPEWTGSADTARIVAPAEVELA